MMITTKMGSSTLSLASSMAHLHVHQIEAGVCYLVQEYVHVCVLLYKREFEESVNLSIAM